MTAAVVLYNNKNGVTSVDFAAVTDALLAGGVFLDETVLLPYDAPSALPSALMRLSAEHKCVVVICDRGLLSAAREAVSAAAGVEFADGTLLQTAGGLYAVLPDGESGAKLAAGETVPAIETLRGKKYLREVIRTVGVPPRQLRDAVLKAEEAAGDSLFIHTSEKYGCGRIEMIYDEHTPKMTADEVIRILATELKDYIYSMRDEEIAARVVEALTVRRMKLATAESFTGGGVGREIVKVPGASKVFYEGLNTYDGASKEDRLGVSHFTLQTKGAVSDEVAYEMAAGLIRHGTCDIAIATTGYAGPDTDGRLPVGLCYLAIGTKENVRVYRRQLSGDRETITETAIRLALFYAFRELK